MDVIQPLRAHRYDPARVDAARVTAPPYDVIDAAEQQALYERDPHNVIRLILGKQFPQDGEKDNRYTRAAQTLAQWRDEKIFLRDKPAFYVYRQEFNEFGPQGGRRVRRNGFFARILLSAWGEGGVYPHEKTLAGPKVDRLELMRATHGNLEPVFGLLADPDGECSRVLAGLAAGRPDVEIDGDDNAIDRLHVEDDPEAVARLSAVCRDPRLYIADGHHRYETALQYRDDCRAALRAAGKTPPAPGELDCDYILMLVVPDSDPGLVIWPTHRVVHGVAGFDAQALLKGAERHFEVEAFAGPVPELTAAMDAHAAPAFGLLLPGGRRFLLRLRADSAVGAMAARVPDAADAWRELDVSVLHVLLLEDLLGIDAGKLLRKENVNYARYADEAVGAVEDGAGGAQCGFLVRATTMAQIRAVSEAGAVMPQKSTYFYPKATSGLLFHFFD